MSLPGYPCDEVRAIAYTATAGTAAAIPKCDFLILQASSACWVQFGASGVAPVAKTAPAFLVGPWGPTIVRRPKGTPGTSGKGVPTHINAIRDAADGTLSVLGVTQ